MDDKISLMFEFNKNNKVAINTPVGQTERINIGNVVIKGSTPAPLLCSNSVDLLGKVSLQRDDNLYKYKNTVNVTVLGATNDILGSSVCGKESLDLNFFINSQIELKN